MNICIYLVFLIVNHIQANKTSQLNQQQHHQQQQQPSVSTPESCTPALLPATELAVPQTQQLRVRVKDIKKLVHAEPVGGVSEVEQPAVIASAPPAPAPEVKKYEADLVKKVFWKKFEAEKSLEKTWAGTPSPEPQVCIQLTEELAYVLFFPAV